MHWYREGREIAVPDFVAASLGSGGVSKLVQKEHRTTSLHSRPTSATSWLGGLRCVIFLLCVQLPSPKNTHWKLFLALSFCDLDECNMYFQPFSTKKVLCILVGLALPEPDRYKHDKHGQP